MTTFTPNFNLDKYEGTDKPDLTDQYNAAMAKIDTALQAALEARAELQNSIGTLNINLTATNTALDAVKTEVDKNTPLVEEHVNYFAALGVTDEDSANALHTEIDNAYQGAVSNTQSISDINETLLAVSKHQYTTKPLTFNIGSDSITYDIAVGICNVDNSIKLYGDCFFTNQVTLDRVAVPGLSGVYGVPSNETLDIPDLTEGRRVVYAGLYLQEKDNVSSLLGGNMSWAIGTDKKVYVCIAGQQSSTFQRGTHFMYFQIPIYFGAGFTHNTSDES